MLNIQDNVLVSHLFPFLDRSSWANLSMTSKVLRQLCQDMSHKAPWPEACFQIGESLIHSLAFSRDGSTLACGADDGLVRLWNRSDEGLKVLAGHWDSVTTVLYSPQDTVLASGSMDCTITLWQTDNVYKCPRILEGHEEGIQVLAFDSDGQILASGSRDATIRLWDVSEGTCTTMLDGRHGGCIRSLAFCSDEKTLVSSSDDRSICLWNLSDSSSTMLERRPEYARNLLLSENGRYLACESRSCDIVLREVSQNKCTLELKGHGQPDRITSVAFSPDCQRLASGSWDSCIRLWNIDNGDCVASLKGHSAHISFLAFASDGETLASGSIDGTLQIWNDLSHYYREPRQRAFNNRHANP
jgi:WD40 repeat protein